MAIEEILPGLFHWRAKHPRIGVEVDSFWLEPEAVLIDPVAPPEGLDWFAQRPSPPRAIVLCNRHHYRQSGEFIARFDCGPVRVPEAGMHDFADGSRPAQGYRPGEELPGGLVAIELGALAPDDGALYLPRLRALWFADSVVRGPAEPDGPLGFVPEQWMDDPSETKRALLAALDRVLAEWDVDHVLMAHGGACVGDGSEELRELVQTGGRSVSF